MAFDMSIFLSGILSGAQVTRGRHIKQALAIQSAISERWGIANPWLWKRKHLIWFRRHHLKKSLRVKPLLLPADDAANCAKDGEALVSARPLRSLRSNLSPDQSTQ